MSKLAILAIVTALVAHASAKCAMTELEAHVLTPAGAKIPAGGGILVGWDSAVDRDYDKPRATGDPSRPAGWTLTDGSAAVGFTLDAIAPGVTLYHPKSDARGSLVLGDGKAEVARFDRAAAGDGKLDLPQPIVQRGVLDTDLGRRSREVSFTVDVTTIPDAAVGVVVYDAKRVATSFGAVAHAGGRGATSMVAYQSASRCTFDPPGMSAPVVGTKVTIAWVDAFGRLSKASEPIAVVAGRSPSP